MTTTNSGARVAVEGNSAGRTRLDADARRLQLLSVGLELLRSRPLDAVTADEVAKEAGVSKGLVFHYFPSTRDLHLELLRTAAEGLANAISTNSDLSVKDRINQGLRGYIDYLGDNRQVYLSLARSAGSDSEMAAVVEGVRLTAVDLVATVIGTEKLPDVVVLASYGWLALVEECVYRWLGGIDIDKEDLVRYLSDQAETLILAAYKLKPLNA